MLLNTDSSSVGSAVSAAFGASASIAVSA